MIKFTSTDQFGLLSQAAILTDSEGFLRDAHAIAAIDDDLGQILAIAVFQNRSTRQSELHFASAVPGGIGRRDVLRGLFAYAFYYLKTPRLIAPISALNTAAQITALKSGFQIAGLLSGGAIDGSDAILMTLIRENCRWLPPPTKAQPTTESAAPERLLS